MKKKKRGTLYVGIVIFLMYFFPVLFTLIGAEFPVQYALLIAILFSGFISLLIILWFKMIIFSIVQPIKRANQIMRIQNARYVDSNDYDYVRDVPNKYSPAFASLLLDQSIEYNKDVIATTLYLINHGYLKEENGKISVMDIKTDNLMEHEIYLIEVYKKNLRFSPITWGEKILDDALKSGLVANKGELDEKDKKKLVINLAIPIAMFFVLFNVIDWLSSMDNLILNIIYMLIFMFLPILGFSIFIYVIVYFLSFISKRIKLTNQGLLEQEKIAKFKKFLNDFSNIEKRKTEELILWEDYLTFAVALGINNKVYWDDNFRKKVNTTNNIIQMEVLNELSKIGS